MGFDATIKRFSPLILLAIIAVIAYFQASGIGHLLASVAVDGAPVRKAAPAPPRRAPEVDRDHATSADAILSRNPFDSVTGPLNRKEPEAPPVDGNDVSLGKDPYEDPPCAGARALLIASSDDPSWSFAAIAGGDGKTVMVRQGQEIAGQKVAFIGDLRSDEHVHERDSGLWERVWLTTGTARCQLALGAKAATPLAKGKDPGPASSSPTQDERVRKIGENRYEVDRSTVDALIANPAELMKVRVIPVRDGERVAGMKLMGIKPGSLLGSLGLVNGDQLTSINGFEMNDPQKMLEAYTKLMRADKLALTVVRQGKPMSIDFGIK